MTREEIEELKGLAASMGLYDDKNPCKRAVILGKAIQELEQEPTSKKDLAVASECKLEGAKNINAPSRKMTREEVLDWLYRLKSEIFVFMPKEWMIPMADALDVGIKALEHPEKNVVSIVPCGDAISRKAVLNQIFYSTDNNGDVVLGSALRERIARLPPVTPQEPKKGHWIECMPRGAEEWCYKCSKCNFWKYKKTINLSKFSFCPNCGADMREVKE